MRTSREVDVQLNGGIRTKRDTIVVTDLSWLLHRLYAELADVFLCFFHKKTNATIPKKHFLFVVYMREEVIGYIELSCKFY